MTSWPVHFWYCLQNQDFKLIRWSFDVRWLEVQAHSEYVAHFDCGDTQAGCDCGQAQRKKTKNDDMVGSLVHLFTWILVLAFFPYDDGDNDDIIG